MDGVGCDVMWWDTRVAGFREEDASDRVKWKTVDTNSGRSHIVEKEGEGEEGNERIINAIHV